MTDLFAELAGKPRASREAVNFDTLSLIQEDELEAMVTVEGMVAAARNQHLPHFISFNTRLNALLEDKRVDESSNPLDPQQIATAFVDAVKPIGLDGTSAIIVYRGFSSGVLRELESVLHAANQRKSTRGAGFLSRQFQQQLVEARDVGCRIIQLPTFRKRRLIVEDA